MKQSSLKIIDKADEMWNNGMRDITPLPDPIKGFVTLSNKELLRLIKQRTQLAWADGVFMGIGLK